MVLVGVINLNLFIILLYSNINYRIEGFDNGLPFISRKVPWIDEEYFEYANSGYIDVNLGYLTLYTKFRDAYSYTFLYSLYLRLFTDNIPSNVDVKYQCWN